jgi:hypothetical protein
LLKTIFVVAHIIGGAIGLGGATMSDLLFFHSIKNRIISKDQFHLLDVASTVVFGGMTLVVLTGVWLIFASPELLEVARVQAKLTAVFVLLVNGFILHSVILKYLKTRLDEPLPERELRSRQWIFAASGSASIVSWYTVFVLASAEELALSYPVLLGAYLAAIAGATVVAYFVFAKKVIQSDVGGSEEVTDPSVPGVGVSWHVVVLTGLLLIFVGSLLYLWTTS